MSDVVTSAAVKLVMTMMTELDAAKKVKALKPQVLHQLDNFLDGLEEAQAVLSDGKFSAGLEGQLKTMQAVVDEATPILKATKKKGLMQRINFFASNKPTDQIKAVEAAQSAEKCEQNLDGASPECVAFIIKSA